MDLLNAKVLVVGTGMSGIGAVQLLRSQNVETYLYDENKELSVDKIKEKLCEYDNVPVFLGEIPKEIEVKLNLLILSPGVPTDIPFVNAFREKNIPIWGEIELAYAFEKGKVIAITGTNGKTTTTSLVGEMVRDYFGNAFVVGNIGFPYTGNVLQTKPDTYTVAEISSFQLETIESFKPVVSAILNITPDHLNRHHTMENYIAVKEAIASNQTKDEVCVLNYENEYTREFGKTCNASVLYFSSERILEKGFYLVNEDIYFAHAAENAHEIKQERIMNIYDMSLVGVCNIENVMAALAIGYSIGISFESMLKTIKNFKAVEHRIEYVATKKGVKYYNDSKGTNPDAAIQGIKAMNSPTILIGGGYDKHNEYDEWIDAFQGKVKKLILIGQTREKIAECARKHGFNDIIFAESLEEVMGIAEKLAEPGDCVLLSPACASWGMFPNYEVRGKMFKEFVYQMED